MAAARHRLEDLSPVRVGGWGAIAGLVIGVLPFTLGSTGGGPLTWLTTSAIIGSITVLSAASAVGSLAIARKGEQRALPIME